MSLILKRRSFLAGLVAIAVEPVIEPVRRTYSFIWTPPEPQIVWPDPEMAKLFVATPWALTATHGLGYIFARRGAE